MEHSHNLGLKSLILVNGLEEGKKLTGYSLGFVLGPCLNATGRLDSAMRGMALLTCDDIAEAMKIAGDLKALNDSRKTMTQEGVDAAAAEMEKYIGKLPDVLVSGVNRGRIYRQGEL
jgi:single-stranded-DNA-specific exonuclease